MSPTIVSADNGRDGASPRKTYRKAIDATNRLIERRARAYRDIVVAVSFIGLTALGWALWWRSVRPLALLLLLAPLSLLCLWQDRWLLNGWRARLLADWTAGVVDFAALRVVLLAFAPEDDGRGQRASLSRRERQSRGGRILPSRALTGSIWWGWRLWALPLSSGPPAPSWRSCLRTGGL